ncbi:MAG: glycoside hydrolase family 127 protein [Actinobacteria bacterium]|nr:glycoside hydrolase family 127 protein [Actinomycetota bacterium]
MSVSPVVPAAARAALQPVAGGMRIRGGFWGRLQQLNRTVTIPHGMRMLEESGSLDNLRAAATVRAGSADPAGRRASDYSLPLFRDSDVYKVLEAVAWERWRGRDDAQERFHAEASALAWAAQRPDGYLNSYVDVAGGGRRFADPAMGHELYCAGHLLQAAVADLRTGGSPPRQGSLAAVAGRYADLLVKQLSGELAGFVPGHPEIEMALAEFARAADRPELVAVAAELIARRGHSTLSWRSYGPDYFSDDVPFEQADTIRGHAVRALYLICGAVDVYAETPGDDGAGLLRAACAQWDDMVAAKTYLTGGVGARHSGESFGDPFELPPDQAYCETCAAIASVMASWRLLLITGQARFADLIERTLYNGVLAGLGLDGSSFFYVNPLHTRRATTRQRWYECACCPPNIMRLLASLDHYMATSTADGVQIHQFAAGSLRAELAAGTLAAEIETGCPHSGSVGIRVTESSGQPADLAVRVPSWATGLAVTVNGHPSQAGPGRDGYLHLRRRWSAGDEVAAEFGLAVQTVRPDPRVDAVRGCVAFERGPLVYCLESVDQPGLPPAASLAEVAAGRGPVSVSELDVAGHRVSALAIPGLVVHGPGADGWPYHSQPGRLSEAGPPPAGRPPATVAGQAVLRAIPYYAWANRGPATMRVWLPEHR